MGYKFERLEVWQLALEYADLIYALAEQLPRSEDFNLKSQIVRAATSVALNIAEGSTSQSNAEQARFLGLAIRSVVETVACQLSSTDASISKIQSHFVTPINLAKNCSLNFNLFELR